MWLCLSVRRWLVWLVHLMEMALFQRDGDIEDLYSSFFALHSWMLIALCAGYS